MLTTNQIEALKHAEAQACSCEQKTGCPAALTVAQWVLESGWGKYSPGNNCFGIKFYAGAFGSQSLATHEYVQGKSIAEAQEFATFETLEDCFEKHARLISGGKPYQQAFTNFQRSHNVEQLIRDIAPHYAPGNPKYVDSLLSVIRMPQVSGILKAA